MVKTSSKALVLLSLALGACGVDGVPAPLEATPAGTGPEIVWNMANRPLPDIPLPNDVATVADPTIADALLDRVVHNAHRLKLKGPSKRKTET